MGAAAVKKLHRENIPSVSIKGWGWEPHGVVAKSLEFSQAGWGELYQHPIAVLSLRKGPSLAELKDRILEMEKYDLEGKPGMHAQRTALYALQLSSDAGILPRTINPTGDESILFEYFCGDDVYGLDFYDSGEIVFVQRRVGTRTTGKEIDVSKLDETVNTISRYAQRL